MQLAYSNAQTLVGLETNRNILIDSSIYGMGRGAGNLNTELFIQYLNENSDGNYELKPLLIVIDEILNIFYQKIIGGILYPITYLQYTMHIRIMQAFLMIKRR